jgi:hypothetical protein
LGERVLNHLILALRDDHQSTPEYKQVYRKESFDNWDVAIDALGNWGVLLLEVVERFRRLRDMRHRTLHFNPATDRATRSEALDALLLFQEIVSVQFAAFGARPWYIPNAPGVSFVRRDQEEAPFVRRVILPGCVRVGPAHHVRPYPDGHCEIIDDTAYPDEEIGDDEFLRRYVETH